MRSNSQPSPLGLLRMQRLAAGSVIGACLILMLAGCAKPLVLDATLPQQFAEISCMEDCRAAKESCHADAR